MCRRRQLKEIFDELGIDHKGLSKEDLKKKAYKEDAVKRWETLHPEKAYKKPKGTPGGGLPGGGFDFGGGSGDPKMEELLRQMRGDVSGETDPEKRRILEKYAAAHRSNPLARGTASCAASVPTLLTLCVRCCCTGSRNVA